MEPSIRPTLCPERLETPGQTLPTLPRWEQLPTERQRELVRTLAALVVKRLPPRPLTPLGAPHD